MELSFSRSEWEFLKRNEKFKTELAKANMTLADFERISVEGSKLLLDWETANPIKAKFKRAKKGSNSHGRTSLQEKKT